MKSPFDAVTEDLKRIREMMLSSPGTAVTEAMRLHLERVRSLTAIPEEIRRTLLSSPATSIVEMMGTLAETVKSQTAISEEVRRNLLSTPGTAVTEAMRLHLERVRSLTAIPEEIRRTLLSSPATSIVEMMGTLAETASQLTEQAKLFRLYDTIPNLNNTFADLVAGLDEQRFQDVHIGADGSVVVDGEAATPAEIHDAIAQLLDQPENFLRNLNDRLAAFTKPLRLIVSWFLINYLAVFSILLTLYLDYRTSIQEQELHQQLQQQILQDGDRTRQEIRDTVKAMAKSYQDLSQWRVVMNPVNVKVQPATKARIMDRLSRGTVVRWVEKRDAWALVEYESPKTGILVKGWAYSKYFKRIGE